MGKIILVGDIGGTKTELALFKEEGKERIPLTQERYSSGRYSDLAELVDLFLHAHQGYQIDKGCFGIAGPIQNHTCRATNLPWIVEASKLVQQLKIPQIFLINDVQAHALGISSLEPEDLFTLNEGKILPGNQALIAAGTGLGEAGLFWDGKQHLPFPCEGGHCSFAPENELEIHLLRYLRKFYDHVSYERLLSGPGLYNIYKFLIEEKIEEEREFVQEGFKKDDPPKVITEMGMKNRCPACARSLELFVSLYGAEAANLSLKMLAIGGVYLGGGIAPKILNALMQGDFMKRFIQKGRFTSLLLNIPVKVILNKYTPLLGALRYARENG